MKQGSNDCEGHRCWTFAGCRFDESSWTLTVSGQRVAIETKPLQVLRELLVADGGVVTKDALLERIWADVIVVEASLPTAIHKLRAALEDNRKTRCIIETVPGIGYRLAVPVEVGRAQSQARHPETAAAPPTAPPVTAAGRRFARPLVAVFGASALLGMAGGSAAALGWLSPAPAPVPEASTAPISDREVKSALRNLDVGEAERLIARGWDPNAALDSEGNNAINYVLNVCEWNRDADPRQVRLMVRTLYDNGARIDVHNVWGDTAFSIAKAVRYCGPNHPVTNMIRTLCYTGADNPEEQCLATYELKRRIPGKSTPM